ncbi:TPA: acylphosphatase [Patescibacteria group bacterium]|nr:MAG: Acylphosphatase [Parcubacteria group bacterium GW2011_GWD2_42_14]HCC05538.1 acylphosphatase [Patescibacteria group bacterium]
MSEKQSELHCIVTGRVQGVAYRNFVQAIAVDLSIKGFVANLPDGSVEVLAQGEYGVLKVFKNHLQKGPAEARVGTVYEEWREPSRKFDRFIIL